MQPLKPEKSMHIRYGYRLDILCETATPIITMLDVHPSLRSEITALAKSPEVTERLTKLGIVPGGLTGEQSEAVFRKDRESFAAAIKAGKDVPGAKLTQGRRLDIR